MLLPPLPEKERSARPFPARSNWSSVAHSRRMPSTGVVNRLRPTRRSVERARLLEARSASPSKQRHPHDPNYSIEALAAHS